jgi:hypothetical protein
MSQAAPPPEPLPETIYTGFQTIAGDEFNSLISRVRASSILTFSRWLEPLIKRALPESSLNGFLSRTFLEDLPASTASGKVVCLCLDSTWNIAEACKALAKVPAYDKTLVVFPRVTTLCKAAVDRFQLEKLNMVELHLDLLPLES